MIWVYLLIQAMSSLLIVENAAAQNQAQVNVAVPSESYSRIITRLNDVRGDLSNWSPAELAALNIAVHQAGEECSSSSKDISGEELLFVAKLCLLAQNWPRVQEVTQQYLNAKSEAHVAEAYQYLEQALINLGDFSSAENYVGEMTRRLSTSPEVLSVLQYVVTNTEATRPAMALRIALLEKPRLQSALEDSCRKRDDVDVSKFVIEGYHLAELQYANHLEADSRQTAHSFQTDSCVASKNVMSKPSVAAAIARYRLLGSFLPTTVQNVLSKLPYKSSEESPTVIIFVYKSCDRCVEINRSLVNLKAGQHQELNVTCLVVANAAQTAHPTCPNVDESIIQTVGLNSDLTTVIVSAGGIVQSVTTGGLDDLRPGGRIDNSLTVLRVYHGRG